MTSSNATRRWYRLLAIVLGFTLLAAACGDDDGGSGGDDAQTDDTGGGVEDEAPTDVEGDPVSGGEISYGLEAETNGGFCLPEAQLAISGIQVARTIYDTLTAPDENGEIQPFLAESVEANEDSTVWTITFRDGITFHDGTPLDATVVKNNLDAYRGAYANREPLLFRFVFANIASVEAPDAKTVVVTMTTPWSAFDWFLWGSSRVGMMAQAQLDDLENCGTNLIGTGPFVLDEWTVNEQLVASKNTSYWQTDPDGNPLPYLDQITYVPIPEIASRINALESGQIQATHNSDTEQIVQRLQPLADDGTIKLTQTDAWGEVNYLMLNMSAPPFDNKNARLAVAHALDRQLLIDVRGGGLGEVADGPFQADVPGYVEATGFPEYDPAAAEAAVAAYEEETGGPLSFRYTFVSTESGQLTAQEIQTQMSAVGIDMQLDPAGDQATTINKALAADFQAVGWRNHPGADPDTQYNWWYEGSPVNFGRIADPEINRLLDEGRAAPLGPERDALYEELNERFGSEVYNLWTSFTIWSIGTSPAVQNVIGYGPTGTGGFPGLGTGHAVSGIWLSE